MKEANRTEDLVTRLRELPINERDSCGALLEEAADMIERINSRRTVVYKNGTYKVIDGATYEYENDPDWLVTI